MEPLSALEIKRRALLLFERMLDLPPDTRERSALFAGESPDVLNEIAALEAAEPRGARNFATDFAMDGAGSPMERPARVGAYRLEALVGEGGMGEVWRAIRDDGLFEHRVAVKLIRPGVFSDIAEARFVEERRLLARLDHPGIARIIDGGVSDGGWPYLITELVEGSPIDRHCADHGCTLKQRVALARDAATAIQAAHGQLIVHADIKPGNLLVTGDGRVRLVDFGIARLIGDDVEAKPRLQPMTRAYASPERMAGALPSVSDDIYALGIVLRDLVQGMVRDSGIAAIVARATAPEAADRYPTMEAMRGDLDRWLADRPVEAHPATLRYRAGRFIRRHRFGAAAAGIAALSLLIAAIAGIIGHVRTQRAQAAEAERIDDLRAVSHYLLFDLQNELARQPNSLAMRTRIAERLQHYLDRMASDPRASPLIRLEAAEGLLRLADQQASPARANLGQPEQARRNLERAGKLLQGLPGSRAALLRARVGMDLARLLLGYDHELSRADALLVAAGKDITAAGPEGARLRGEWLTNRAMLRGWQNRYADAIADARAAMREALPVEPQAAALLSARMEDVLAESLFYNGDREGAVEPYRSQLAILAKAMERWPESRKVRRDFARATWALGTTLIDLGRSGEALPLLEQGRAVAHANAAQDRDDADAERIKGIVEIAYAQALGGVGRADEAISVMNASVERRRAEWQARPGEAMRLRDYTIGIAALGDLLAEHGHVALACRTYADAEARFDDLRRAGKLVEADQAYSLRLLEEAQARYCRR